MAALTVTLTVPDFACHPSPHGGMVAHGVHPDRSFAAVIRRVPGRMVSVKDVYGVRHATAWTAVETPEDASRAMLDLMMWAMLGR